MSIKHAAKCGFLRFKNWWFFGAPTFWLDLILALGLMATGAVFAIDGDVLIAKHHIYQKFNEVPLWLLSMLPIWSGGWLLVSIRHSDMSVGFARLWASFIWGLGFVAYYQSYPPLSTNILLSLMLAFFGFLASFQQIFAANQRDKCEKLIADGKAANECKKC